MKEEFMKGKKMVSTILYFIVAAVIIVFLILGSVLLASAVTGSGTIEQFTDDKGDTIPGSVAEKIYIEVNGRKNGLIIRGKSENNPVLLFISGGPGVPQYWLNDSYKTKYPNNIEDEFTVCWWDYIGEGLSYDASIDPSEITLEKLTDDACVVCDYLKERFGVEKVYLMAHSGGTMLGMNLAIEKPEYFYCYFGMGQVTNPGYDRHEAGYKYMKDYFEKTNQKGNLKKLKALVCEKNGHIVLNDKYHEGYWEKILLKAGCGTTREMRSDAFGIFFPQMLSHCYTLTEKINYWKGKALLAKSPYSAESKKIYELVETRIPVIFLSGTYDYTTPIDDVRTLYEKIESKEKAFYEFSESAHSPLWEENEKVLEVMRSYVR